MQSLLVDFQFLLIHREGDICSSSPERGEMVDDTSTTIKVLGTEAGRDWSRVV